MCADATSSQGWLEKDEGRDQGIGRFFLFFILLHSRTSGQALSVIED